MKNKLLKLSFITLLFTVLLITLPIVSAKTRQNYLTDFLFEHQVNNEMFGDTYEDTSYALEIIDFYDLYQIEGLFGSETKVDVSEFKDNLESKVEDMFADEDIDIYNLYYLLRSLEILGASLTANLKTKIYKFINGTILSDGGFAPTNTSTSANMISTFLIYRIYSLIDEPIVNQTTHKNWILSCNNTDGGYGGNKTLSSTLLTTFYAVFLIDDLGSIDDLDNKTATLNYLKSFYVSDQNDLNNYGGYLPDRTAENALLSSTYYCVQSIHIIDKSELHKTATLGWVLNRQNFQDGGFIDDPSDVSQGLSSIPASYYAFKTLNIFDATILLDQDIFMVEFNYIILIVVLSVIGLLIVLIIYIKRKRRI